MMFLVCLIVSVHSLRVLHVQQAFFARKPVVNPDFFHLFAIDEKVYRFMHLNQSRVCQMPDNCILHDYVEMLRVLQRYVLESNRRVDYIYVIEDDTYFCGDALLLGNLASANAHLNVSMLFTGLGASGYLIRFDYIDTLIATSYKHSKDLLRSHNKARYGVDLVVLSGRLAAARLFRSKVHLNIHLCNGSTRNKVFGKPGCLYGTCFEYSCGKFLNNAFGFNKCVEFDLYNSKTGCVGSSRGILPQGHYANHCMRELNKTSPH
jgi:hypothetical protein